MIQQARCVLHQQRSCRAASWPTGMTCSPKFVKVMPKDYKRMLEALTWIEQAGLSGERAEMAAFEANKGDASSRERKLASTTTKARILRTLSLRQAESCSVNPWPEGHLMGKPTGFMEYLSRAAARSPAPSERTLDYLEFHLTLSEEKLQNQAARCMSCGLPFCHTGRADQWHGFGLSVEQSDPGMEQPCLQRSLG